MNSFDLVVIGAGIAATLTANRCASEGSSVAVVDELPYGGSCALRGCDPKKMLRRGAEIVDAVHLMRGKGIETDALRINWPDLMALPGCRMRRSSNQVENAHWMAVLELDGGDATAVIDGLVERGVGARPAWRPLNQQRAFADATSLPTPVSDRLYRSTICLPCSSGMTEGELDRVADAVREELGS